MAVALTDTPTVSASDPLVPLVDPDTGEDAVITRTGDQSRLAVCKRGTGPWVLAREIVKYQADDNGKRAAANGIESRGWKATGSLTDIKDAVEGDLISV